MGTADVARVTRASCHTPRLASMVRHVIWDMGGTLVDTYPQLHATFVEVVAAHGKRVTPAEIARLTHDSTAHAIANLSARFGIDDGEFEEANSSLKRHWESEPPPAVPGARRLMRDLADAGGLNLVATHRDRRSATSLLDTLALPVNDLICPEDGYPRKPDPAMFRALLERHGLDPARCLAVGDRPIDAEAAHAARIEAARLTVRVPELPAAADPPETAEHVVTALEHLRPVLGL